MDFLKVVDELKSLQTEIEENKVDTRFEKNKLYDYLGKSLVESLEEYNVILAGGTIASLFTSSEINDIDLYFRSKEDFAAFAERVMDGEWITSHTNKSTLFQYDELPVQLIHFSFFKEVEDVFNSFDFTVCMGAFDFKTREFVFHKDFLKHNSQKILKFNSNTDYPLVSLMRTDKYQKKGYSISKTEMFRIILTCMDLKIDSYDELEDHLGGMYGESFDNILEELDKEEEFDLAIVIDKIKDLSLREDYFKEIKVPENPDIQEIIKNVCNIKRKYFTAYNDRKYGLSYDGKTLEKYYDPEEDDEEVDGNDYIQRKLYKFVKKVDDRYYSFYDNSFEYVLGEIVEGNSTNGLYFNEFDKINQSSFYDKVDKILIEVEVDAKDLIDRNYATSQFKKCKMLREVPEEEWNKSTDKSLEKAPF